MAGFQQPLDIFNRALQHLGLPRAGSTSDQQAVQEVAASYDDVRRAELRRNLWVCATKTAALRAIDTTSRFLTFEAYNSATTYTYNYVVTYNSNIWVSQLDDNVGNTPGAAIASGEQAWVPFFGPLMANPWNSTLQNTSTSNNISYWTGELVYYLSTGNIYISLVDGNQNDPTKVDTWSASLMYLDGDVVSFTPSGGSATNYQSIGELNFNNEPDTSPAQWTTTITSPTVSRSWVQLTGASLTNRPIIYPLNAGPANDTSTRNAFFKPSGWLRKAPLAPKSGAFAYLGAHVGIPYSDRIYQGDYITTSQEALTIIERFVADVTDVDTFDSMLSEGLAARLAWETSPLLAPDRRRDCQAAYTEKMAEARLVDAIEQGPVEQDEDEYITVRN